MRLDAVCDIIMGQAPAGDEYNDKGEGLPLLAGAGDFKSGRPVAKKFTRVVTKQCVEGDLVIGIRASIGDMVVADRPYCLGRGVAVIRPKAKEVVPRYLWHWMASVRPALEQKAKGATFKQVNRADIGELRLSVPTRQEQLRIAAILDQAEELRAKRRAAIALLEQLSQVIFFEMFGDPETNRHGLKTAQLGDLCTRITDSTHQPPKFAETGHPFIFVRNIVSGEIDFDTEKFISEETHHELTRRCPIEVGDVIYSTVGSYGIPAQVRSPRKFAFQRHIAHLKPDRTRLLPEFLCSMLASTSLKKQADAEARGVAQKTINLADIRRYVVLAPPVQLQQEFVNRLELLRHIKSANRIALTEHDKLCGSLQKTLLEVQA